MEERKRKTLLIRERKRKQKKRIEKLEERNIEGTEGENVLPDAAMKMIVRSLFQLGYGSKGNNFTIRVHYQFHHQATPISFSRITIAKSEKLFVEHASTRQR
ncbi:hypothetical protein ES332_D08G029900v1 [Gossypium tomentosum]|uniref:Uncharacterized protein n=1 Tax=Gossypium tomentosum TaxID=34277 RepID=A0A5D2JRE5_GOSTO|nr:hypothetical protein ES332_D08G029900v1 [Gossypium tomentosum]